MDLVEQSYKLTAGFPRDELYGLTSQIRRSAVSIPANIAEGFGRDQTGSFIQFLRIAQGSARELETHLLIAERLALADSGAIQLPKQTCDRVSKMLRAYIRSIDATRTPVAKIDRRPDD
jgi:four helix bundle protein